MRERERHGVRIGQPVRDLDGKSLGQVSALYESGFQVAKGLPILLRREHVLLYDEVRGERDGALVVARSDRALLELAEGAMPGIWRVPAPPGFPAAATPSEARAVFAEVALGHAVSGASEPATPPEPTRPVAAPAPLADEEVRAYQDTRGQASVPPPPGG